MEYNIGLYKHTPRNTHAHKQTHRFSVKLQNIHFQSLELGLATFSLTLSKECWLPYKHFPWVIPYLYQLSRHPHTTTIILSTPKSTIILDDLMSKLMDDPMHSSFCFLISCLMIFISLSLNQFSFILIFNFQDYLTWLNTPCLSLVFMTTLISFDFSDYLFINHFFVYFLFLPILICLCSSRLYSRPSLCSLWETPPTKSYYLYVTQP